MRMCHRVSSAWRCRSVADGLTRCCLQTADAAPTSGSAVWQGSSAACSHCSPQSMHPMQSDNYWRALPKDGAATQIGAAKHRGILQTGQRRCSCRQGLTHGSALQPLRTPCCQDRLVGIHIRSISQPGCRLSQVNPCASWHGSNTAPPFLGGHRTCACIPSSLHDMHGTPPARRRSAPRWTWRPACCAAPRPRPRQRASSRPSAGTGSPRRRPPACRYEMCGFSSQFAAFELRLGS